MFFKNRAFLQRCIGVTRSSRLITAGTYVKSITRRIQQSAQGHTPDRAHCLPAVAGLLEVVPLAAILVDANVGLRALAREMLVGSVEELICLTASGT